MSPAEIIQKLTAVDSITAGLNAAERVICMSQILKQACVRAGVHEEKLFVLGNRVSTIRFQPSVQENYDPKLIRILFVGRIQKQKNLHGIANALALLKGQGWRIWMDICGGQIEGDYLHQSMKVLEMREWSFRENVANRQLCPIYNSADMYVGPSFFEGFQIPLIEALACGKPCVVSNQPPASEIIHSGTGALVNPELPEAIAGGILSIKLRLNDPKGSDCLRRSCREEAVRRWNYEIVSKMEAEIYIESLKNFQIRSTI